MKSKRIIAFLLVLAIVSSFVLVPVYAVEWQIIEGIAGWAAAEFGSYIVGETIEGSVDGSLEKKLYDFIHPFEVGDCTVSSDRDHHWVQSFYNDDSGLPHVEYRCSACNAYLCRGGTYQSGDGFSGRAGVFEDAYDDYVEELTYPGVSNVGGYMIDVSHSYTLFNSTINSVKSYCSHKSSAPKYSFDCSDSSASVSASYISGYGSSYSFSIHFYWSVFIPVAGLVHVVERGYDSSNCSLYSHVSSVNFSSGGTYDLSGPFFSGSLSTSVRSCSASSQAPIAFFIPKSVSYLQNVTSNDSEFAPSTRITNYALNLGTIVNGDVTNVYQNTTIINETDKILTVPSTGTTYNITNWFYNYTDRSVSGTLDNGDDYDVTFGDDILIVHVGEDEYASVNVDQDITIDLPDIDFGIEFADDEGEIHVWHLDDLKAKFAFWKDVRDIGTELYASVQPTAMRSGSTTGPPELILHLGDANSHYGFEYGGDEYAMDLSWYDEYKPTVDSIVGGFLWLLYLYGVFKHLPEILSGVGMMDNRIEDIQSGNKGSRRRNG